MPPLVTTPTDHARGALRDPLLWGVALLVGVWCALHAGGFIDLRVYRMGGGGIGGGALYDLSYGDIGLPYTYPPFAAVVMVPLAHLPMPLVAGLWAASSTLALGLVIARTLAATGLQAPLGPGLRRWAPGLLLAAGLGLEPVWSTLSFGQVNLLLLALVVLDLLPRRDPAGADRSSRWQGVGVGLAAGIKLTPLIFVPYLVLTGRWRAAATALATFAVTVAAGFVVDARSAAVFWTRAMWDPDRVGGVAYAGNQSTLGFLTRLLGEQPSTAVWFAVAGSLAGAALLLGVLWHRRGEAALGLCLVGVAMLLASPISWEHHWVWCVPTALALAAWLGRTAARLRVPVLAGWLAVFFSACVWWGPERDDRELGWTFWQAVPGNGYWLAALALLVLVGSVSVVTAGGRREPFDQPGPRSPGARRHGDVPARYTPPGERRRSPAAATATTEVTTSAPAGANVVQGARST